MTVILSLFLYKTGMLAYSYFAHTVYNLEIQLNLTDNYFLSIILFYFFNKISTKEANKVSAEQGEANLCY